mmetsp:Transcript_83142/g.268986  ORF Transcript_83142/g.268986 Transcript_83142/m.268986 type:complete len:663 (-) Transcript_83142:494-2482(-)
MPPFRVAVLALAAKTVHAASCVGGLPIGGVEGSYLMGDGGRVSGDALTLRHNSGFSITGSCQGGEWDPEAFTPFKLLGKTLSFSVNLSRVSCGCNLGLYLVHGPARDASGSFSKGTCAWSPYYCDANQVCGQWCPELDVMEANSRVFSSTPHSCDAPSQEGHYRGCDRTGCGRSTSKMGGDAYGPGARYKIDTTRPFEVHAAFHGSGLPSFTGMTTRLRQGGNEVVLDFSGCGAYFGDLAGSMAGGMSMHITYWGGAASTMGWLDQPPCGDERCDGERAGEAMISNVKITSTCTRELAISGITGASFVSGEGGSVSGDRLELSHNSGFSITTTCEDHWDPNSFTLFELLGKTLSFTVDLSRVGCGCNLALYLINGPAKDEAGNPSLGTCPWSPYYCDANKVCGQWCPEIDIMEGNSHAFASTPHKCDTPTSAGHYSNCDRNGCAQNTRNLGSHAYGPGANHKIDTSQPFHVHTSFHGTVQAGGAGPGFTGMTTRLQQGGSEVVLDHSNCGSYLRALTAPMMEGMAMRITYWGSDASTMSWLDQPPCGETRCSGRNAGDAAISNITIRNIGANSGAGASRFPGDGASPGSAATPLWVPMFVWLSCMQCSFLIALGAYAACLYQRGGAGSEPGPVEAAATAAPRDSPAGATPSCPRSRSAMLQP